jgi:fibronectin-binding autotransporter adhesin
MICFRKLVNAKFIAAAAAATAGMIGSQARAATWNWASPSAGTFSAPASWQQGTVPVSSQDTALIFPSGGSYTATNDLTGSFNLNSLTISGGTSGGGPTISGTSGNPLNFVASSTGVNPVINVVNNSLQDYYADLSTNANLTINIPNNYINFYFAGNLSGNGTVTINGGGSIDFTNNNDFTGTLIINNTDLNGTSPDPQYGVGFEYDGFSTSNIGLSSASHIVINPTGTLFLGVGTERAFTPTYLNASGTLTMNGGVFYNRGEGYTAAYAALNPIQTQTEGTIAFASGFSYTIIGHYAASTDSITTGSVTRAVGAVDALMGGAGGPGNATGISQFISTTPITVIGGSGGAGSETQAVVPWMIGTTSLSASNLSNFSNFVTYDGSGGAATGGSGGNGFRTLTSAEMAPSFTDGPDPVHNDVSAGWTTISGNTTINAYQVTGNPANAHLATGSPATLTISSGQLILAGNGGGIGTDTSTAETGTIAFGAAEGVIFVAGQNNGGDGAPAVYDLRVPISGSGGLTVAATSQTNARTNQTESLVLSTSELYTGPTTVAGGILTLGGAPASGTVSTTGNCTLLSTSVTTASDGTLNINAGSTIPTSAVLNDNGIVNANGTTLPIATLNGSGALKAGAVSVSNGGSFSGIFGNGVSTGSLALSGGTLTMSGVNTYTGGTNVSGGTLALTVTGAMPVNSALTIGASGTVSLVNHGTNPKVVLETSSLSNAGKLDLNNNDLIAFNGSLSTIAAQLKSGFKAGTGYWNGTTGIVSTAAASDPLHITTLGYMAGGSTFDGVSTSASAVLVKYTYYGDANLDGTVNGADYQQIDNGFGLHLTGWQNGDFNYDGVVDGSDFSLIDNTFNQINASGASPLALIGSSALIASPASTVPEPTTIGLLGLGAIGLLSNRRRRK